MLELFHFVLTLFVPPRYSTLLWRFTRRQVLIYLESSTLLGFRGSRILQLGRVQFSLGVRSGSIRYAKNIISYCILYQKLMFMSLPYRNSVYRNLGIQYLLTNTVPKFQYIKFLNDIDIYRTIPNFYYIVSYQNCDISKNTKTCFYQKYWNIQIFFLKCTYSYCVENIRYNIENIDIQKNDIFLFDKCGIMKFSIFSPILNLFLLLRINKRRETILISTKKLVALLYSQSP